MTLIIPSTVILPCVYNTHIELIYPLLDGLIVHLMQLTPVNQVVIFVRVLKVELDRSVLLLCDLHIIDWCQGLYACLLVVSL